MVKIQGIFACMFGAIVAGFGCASGDVGELPTDAVGSHSQALCSAVRLVPSPASPVARETDVQLTATPTCEAGDTPEYQFSKLQVGRDTAFQVIRDYASDATASFGASGRASGRYRFQVQLRRPGSGVEARATYNGVYLIGDVCDEVTLNTPAAPFPQGSTATLSALARCRGTAQPEYQFAVRPIQTSTFTNLNGGAWGAASVGWNTTGLAPGRYEVRVRSRAQGNSSDYEAATSYAYFYVGEVCNGVTLGVSPPAPQVPGALITLSASADCTPGATPEYKYVWLSNSGYQTIRDWDRSAVATWNTTGMTELYPRISTWVRARGNASDPYEANDLRYYSLRAPTCTGAAGGDTFCQGCLCGGGQGDCDSDNQCAHGLICGHDQGPKFSFEGNTDVCVPGHCTNGLRDPGKDELGVDCGGPCGSCLSACTGTPGANDFCVGCQCASGQGDCDADSECALGLVCGDAKGPQFGQGAGTDVCVPAHCENGIEDSALGEEDVDCGGPCGTCLQPCRGSAGGNDFCVGCLCDHGQGDCDANSECLPGLTCGDNNGPAFGLPTGYDVCVLADGSQGGGGTQPVPNNLSLDYEPLVYSQEIWDIDGDGYHSAWEHWRDLGYTPVGLASNRTQNGIITFDGIWEKRRDIEAWVSRRGLSHSEYQSLWDELVADGYRVIDVDVYERDDERNYNAIWVKDRGGRPAFASHAWMSRAELNEHLATYGADGLRPLKLNMHNFGTHYSGVWVGDGLEHKVHIDLSSDEYHARWLEYRDQGYHPSDISSYGDRFTGIWVRGDGVRNWVSLRGMSHETLSKKHLQYKNQNYRLIDLDSYSPVFGVSPGTEWMSNEHSAIWVQTEPRNELISNKDLSHPDLVALAQTAANYQSNGQTGFFIEDLTNGNFVAYNPDEPFYLASSAKVLIAARTITAPGFDPATLVRFDEADWRGEDDRGFGKSDIGNDFPLSRYLDNMIDRSDTASTDVLHGRAQAALGANAVTHYASSELNLWNVDDITSICTLDKRIMNEDCTDDMSCLEFESWRRGNDISYLDVDDLLCAATTASPSHAKYQGYYRGLANTITPRAMSKFWRDLGAGTILAGPGQRATLLDLLADNQTYRPSGLSSGGYGGKGGDKYRVKSWVATSWEWAGAANDFEAITPQFSINVFTENWTQTNGDAQAQALIGSVVKQATDYLLSVR